MVREAAARFIKCLTRLLLRTLFAPGLAAAVADSCDDDEEAAAAETEDAGDEASFSLLLLDFLDSLSSSSLSVSDSCSAPDD